MFHQISDLIQKRMQYLVNLDTKDRENDTPLLQRLRQVPPETGKLLTLLAASAPPGQLIEIGTSAGYSSLWLSLACQETNRKVFTFEILEEKVKLARETFRISKVEDFVEIIEGDARELLIDFQNIAFCFLDAEKEYYQELFDLVIPKMVSGGLFVADNVISHEEELKSMLDNVFEDKRVDALIIPIGKGLLLCRKV
jgi:predicted O-methyltransferase YrrM